MKLATLDSQNINMNHLSAGNPNTKHSSPTQSQSHACAACKYQRRKCSKDCPLAPYIPSSNEDFMNVHRLFGVSKITKLLNKLGLENRDAAVKCVMFEAGARKADPVGGCYGIIVSLWKEIELCEAELEMVMRQVSVFRVLAKGCNVVREDVEGL